jgi:hypothetical protein
LLDGSVPPIPPPLSPKNTISVEFHMPFLISDCVTLKIPASTTATIDSITWHEYSGPQRYVLLDVFATCSQMGGSTYGPCTPWYRRSMKSGIDGSCASMIPVVLVV